MRTDGTEPIVQQRPIQTGTCMDYDEDRTQERKRERDMAKKKQSIKNIAKMLIKRIINIDL